MMRGRLIRIGPVVAAVCVFVLAATAFAYFTAKGKGSVTGQTGSLSAPTGLAANPGSGTVSLSWNAVTPPASGTVTYYVSRNGGAPAGTCATSSAPTTATSCTDNGLAVGTYQYTVTAVWQSWSATSATVNATVAQAVDHFTLSAPTTANAGTSFNVTLTAKDSSGATVTGYTGSQSITFAGPPSSPNATAPSYPATVSFTAGVGTASITLYDSGSSPLHASQGVTNSQSVSITVAPAAASTFAVQTPASPTAGSVFNETLTALDAYGNTATSYTGVQTISFSGPASSPGANAPSYPASLTFSGGIGTGSITLYDAQTTALTATQSTVTGSSGSFTVSTAAASMFGMPTPSTQTAGTAFNETLTAQDSYGNTVSSYAGAKSVTFGGPASSPDANAPAYPVNVTFTAGAGTAPITLYDSQSTTLTAHQGSISGATGSFTVSATSAATFSMPTPSAQTAGTAFNETLTALDAYGNTATGYAGAKSVAFSGPASSPGSNAPSYPASVTFTSGVGTASITLDDAQSTTLSASQGSIPGATGSFTVAPAGAATFSMPTPSTKAAGTAFNETLTALDAYGNTATGYTGVQSVTFGGPATSPGGNAPSYPATVTFASGAGTASITLYDAQSTSLTATQGTVAGSSGSFTVTALAATQIAFTTQPSGATAGAPFTTQPVVAGRDTYGNTQSSYSGTVTLSIKSGTGTVGAALNGCSGALSAGVTTFSGCQINLFGTGYQLTASDGTLSATTSAFNVVAGGNTVTQTATGTYTLTVPPGFTSFTFTIAGAGGGGGQSGAGGKGGTVSGTVTIPLSLTSTTFTVIVGGAGGGGTGLVAGTGGTSGTGCAAGGAGGTGHGGSASNVGGGGGGATCIYLKGSAATMVAVAGGGGGGGAVSSAATGGSGGGGPTSNPGTNSAVAGGASSGSAGGGAASTLTAGAFPFTVTPTGGAAGTGGTATAGGTCSAGVCGAGGTGSIQAMANGSGGGGGGGGMGSGGGGGGGTTAISGGGGGGSAYTGGGKSGTNSYTVTVSSASNGGGSAGGAAAAAGTAGSVSFTGVGLTLA